MCHHTIRAVRIVYVMGSVEEQMLLFMLLFIFVLGQFADVFARNICTGYNM